MRVRRRADNNRRRLMRAMAPAEHKHYRKGDGNLTRFFTPASVPTSISAGTSTVVVRPACTQDKSKDNVVVVDNSTTRLSEVNIRKRAFCVVDSDDDEADTLDTQSMSK